jgi:hypothetical protein
MSVKPKTIDNLGVEASVRYAKDKELFESHLIEESKLIPQKTTVQTLTPYVSSDFDELFAVERSSIWAAFSPPPEYQYSAKPLFSYQLIPSLGSPEKLEAESDKLQSLEDALHKEHKEGQEQQDDSEEKERQALLALLKCIKQLDKTLSLINARRNQYQKG